MTDRPFAICRNGSVFLLGDRSDPVFLSPCEVQPLRDHFASIPQTDWFYPTAQRFAADLDVAMRQASEDVEAVIAARQLEPAL